MKPKTFIPALLCALWIAAPASGQEEKPTVDQKLAVRVAKDLFESTKDSQRKSLLRAAKKLNDGEQAVLVAWAKSKTKDPRIGNLIPALAKIQNKSVARLLGSIAANPPYEDDRSPAGTAAFKALLMTQKSGDTLPILVSMAILSEDSAVSARARRSLIRLIKDGPGPMEKVSTKTLQRLFVRAIRETLRAREAPPAARQRGVNLVAEWVAQTNGFSEALRLVASRLGDEDRVALEGLLKAIPKRKSRLSRRIDLARALEINRRAKLSESRRDSLKPIDDWLEDHIRRDKGLQRVSRRLKEEGRSFEEILIAGLEETENTRLQLEILKIAPQFAKGPESDWVPALVDLLEVEDRRVASQAYALLKQATGESLPQNAVVWGRWLERGEQTENSGGGE